MLALFSSIEHLVDRDTLILQGEFKGKLTDGGAMPTIFFQERVLTDEFFIPQRIFLDTKWNENTFSCSINFQEIAGLLKKERIWDCHISHKNKSEKIEVEMKNRFKMEHFSLPGSFLKTIAYVTKFNTLALSVTAKDFSPRLINGHVDNKKLTSIFTISDEQITAKDIQLVFKERIQPDLMYHRTELVYPVNRTEDGQFSSEMELSVFLDDNKQPHKTIWDVMVKITNGQASTEQALITEKKGSYLGKAHHISPYKNTYFYQNFNKFLSLAVSTTKRDLATVKKISEANGDILIEGKANEFAIERIFISKDSSAKHSELSVEALELSFTQNGEEFSAALPINQVKHTIPLIDNESYVVKTELSNKEVTMVLPVYFNETTEVLNNFYQIDNDFQLILNEPSSEKVLTFTVKQKTMKPTANSLKIAINGSCFSRLAFSSHDYYNPGYKKKYELVHTQFHSSMISLMSKPVEFPKKKFKGFNKKEVSYIESDFVKDFFDRIKETSPDFLILDFYVDGFKDVILFDEEKAITVNYMLRSNVNYLYEIGPKVKVLTHDELDTYLSYWKKAMKKFAKKITEYVPAERIILQKVRRIDKYMSESGKIEKFKEAEDNVKRSNYLYEYMENYFLSLLPTVKTIDLTDTDYISHHEHPISITPDHYESGYYKEYLQRLDDIVLQYLIDNPTYLKKKHKKWFW